MTMSPAHAALTHWLRRLRVDSLFAPLFDFLVNLLVNLLTGALIATLLLMPATHAGALEQASAPAPENAGQRISPAETLLFQTRHLDQLRPPSVLLYKFRKSGSLEEGFDDTVTLKLDTSKASTVQFLSGPHRYPMPEIDHAEGNPVLLAFLERDIADMHRLTGGASNYFRKRIRLALAETAQVKTRRFDYLGQVLEGREVCIEPYRDDPMRERFKQFAGKRYTFLLSSSVPGSVYQLHTLVPDVSGKDQQATARAPPARHKPPGGMPAAAGNATSACGSALTIGTGKTDRVDETLTLVGLQPAKP
jgi:hypothetical protein